MPDVYVYYRIEHRMAARAGERIDALLEAMRPHCTTPGRRSWRCDDPTTWMEIYEGVDDLERFSTALAAAVDAYDCARFTCGERHVECFERAGQSG